MIDERAAPFVLPLLSAALVSASLAGYAWRRRAAGRIPFAILMLGAAYWNVTYTLTLASPDASWKLFWHGVEYFGIAAVPFGWIAFALAYTGNGRWLSPSRVWLFALEPIATLIVTWTNDSHGLLWSRVGSGIGHASPMIEIDFGPWYWVNIAYAYGLILLASVLLVSTLIRPYPRQALVVVLAVLAPVLGDAAFNAGTGLAQDLDPAPFGVAISGLFIVWGFMRYGFLDLAPIARDAIVEGMRDAVVVLDRTGCVVQANEAAVSLLATASSAKPGRLVGRSAKDVFAGPWLPALNAVSDDDETHAEVDVGEGLERRCYEVVASTLRQPGMMGVGRLVTLREVTERRRAEEASARSEKLFRSLIENGTELITILDAEGRFRYHTPSLTRMMGYTDGELIGRLCFELIHPDDRESVEAAFYQVLSAASGATVSAEYRFRHADGTWRIIESVASNLLGDPWTAGIVVNSHDITEREKAREALQEAERRELRTENLRALGQMASGIAHDLNQALTLISGYGDLAAESLAQKPTDAARAQEMLHVMAQAALDGGASVNRLLSFARASSQQSQEAERVQVAELLQEVTRLTAPRWRDGAQAEGRPIDVLLYLNQPEACVVEGWRTNLRDAFTNLVFNAIDALPSGGTLRLGAGREGDRVVVEVRDDGMGIPDEVRERMFEPFFTTKGERGTGLGLATVRSVVEQHHGRVEVESSPGTGTTFRLTFPAAQSAHAAAPTNPPPVEPIRLQQRPLRVLAVDDEPTIVRMIELLLRRLGHQPSTARSAEQALGLLEEARYDVVLSDLGLGAGMTGWDLAALVRDRWSGTRFVLATGWGAGIDPEEARERGVDAVLTKPYRAAEVARILGSLDSAESRPRRQKGAGSI